jgi:hypothetical protein
MSYVKRGAAKVNIIFFLLTVSGVSFKGIVSRDLQHNKRRKFKSEDQKKYENQ